MLDGTTVPIQFSTDESVWNIIARECLAYQGNREIVVDVSLHGERTVRNAGTPLLARIGRGVNLLTRRIEAVGLHAAGGVPAADELQATIPEVPVEFPRCRGQFVDRVFVQHAASGAE